MADLKADQAAQAQARDARRRSAGQARAERADRALRVARRRVRWERPPGQKRPDCLVATINALSKAVDRRGGPIWEYLAMKAPVYVAGGGNPKARRKRAIAYRQRAFRSDGASSFLAMVSAMLFGCDIRTGLLGKPRPEGGPWRRYGVKDLCRFAFGGLVADEVNLRRGERALRVASVVGFLKDTKQQPKLDLAKDKFTSDPALRWLNLDALCRVCGTLWLLKRDRLHADQRHGRRQHGIDAAEQRNETAPAMGAATPSPTPADAPAGPPERPNGTADPPPRTLTPTTVADILALNQELGLKRPD